jgi:hypothetical protein
LLRPGRERISGCARGHSAAKAGFRHEEHETMDELSTAGEPNDVVVIAFQREIVANSIEQPFDGDQCPLRFRKMRRAESSMLPNMYASCG